VSTSGDVASQQGDLTVQANHGVLPANEAQEPARRVPCPAGGDEDDVDNVDINLKTLSYFIKLEREQNEETENHFARTVLMVDEVDDETGKIARTWAPITSATFQRTEEANPSRQMSRARAMRAYKERIRAQGAETRMMQGDDVAQARSFGVQTETLSNAERAAIARKAKKPEALPISEATDDELARFMVNNRVRFPVPPGICDDEDEYPDPWIVECSKMSGTSKNHSRKAVMIDTLYVGYTGKLSDVKPEDNPVTRPALQRAWFHVSRQPSTMDTEMTVREMLARDRPQADMLHDLLAQNYDQFSEMTQKKKKEKKLLAEAQDAAEAVKAGDTKAAAPKTPVTRQAAGSVKATVQDLLNSVKASPSATKGDGAGAETPHYTASSPTAGATTGEHGAQGPVKDGHTGTVKASETALSPDNAESQTKEDGAGTEAPHHTSSGGERDWTLHDGRSAQDLIGSTVEKEFKRKGEGL